MIACQCFLGGLINVCTANIGASRVHENIVFENPRFLLLVPVFSTRFFEIVIVEMVFKDVLAVDYI